MRAARCFFLVFLLVGALLQASADPGFCQGILIDHTCTDLSRIPAAWIDQVKSTLKVHYAHTSHGEQITAGLEQLAGSNANYSFYRDYCSMPQDTQSLSLMDGQYTNNGCETYVPPELYWQGNEALDITRFVLNSFDINVSGWAWCTQLDYYSASEVQSYLDAMSALESEYPHIQFIYMTSNAQSPEPNRQERNQQIRNYCRDNNKILFDFADLDSWYNGQQYVVNGIPMEHPRYHGEEAGHTTFESCENKARAFWWLLARVAGWDGTPSPSPSLSYITVISPNGGEVWRRGAQRTITWAHDGDSEQTVRIYLTRDGWRVNSIVRSTPLGAGGIGSYTLQVPGWLPPGARYRIVVESIEDPGIRDISDGFFLAPRWTR